MTSRQQVTHLKWFDILILTVIMFGEGIFNSTMQYLALQHQTRTIEENLTFSTFANYQALAMQLVWLSFAIFYLVFRNFDFSVIKQKIKLTPWLPLQTIGFFLIAALAMDIYYYLTYQLTLFPVPSMFQLLPNIDLSLLLYSLLNGFYEEVFFLGICLAVKPEYTKWAFLYSLLVRTSFHTYQGIGAALGIGLVLGTVFYLIYKHLKPQNLLPFFLAHAIADVIGLTILSYILY